MLGKCDRRIGKRTKVQACLDNEHDKPEVTHQREVHWRQSRKTLCQYLCSHANGYSNGAGSACIGGPLWDLESQQLQTLPCC